MKDWKCIYCLKEKPESEFDSEHVLHYSMTKGTADNLTLTRRVCKLCNGDFGKSIDQTFGRSGPQGLLRFDHGLKPLKELHQFDGSNSIQAVQSDDPYYDGALAIPIIKNGQRDYDYIPVVQFEKTDGKYVRVTLKELPNLHEIIGRKDLTGVVGFLGNATKIEKLFNEKLSELGRSWEPGKYIAAGEHPVIIQHSLSEDEARALSKVAFNYLAFTTQDSAPELVFLKCFNPVRTFINSGLISNMSAQLGVVQCAAIPYLGSVRLSHCHLVAIDAIEFEDSQYVACILSLFQRIVFIVYLTWDFPEKIDLASAHCWTLDEGKKTIQMIDKPELQDFIKYARSVAQQNTPIDPRLSRL